VSSYPPQAGHDWIDGSRALRDATVCLDSALEHHDLTDSIPRRLHPARFPGSLGAEASSDGAATFARVDTLVMCTRAWDYCSG
jgi:hypothetical protein